MSSGMTSVPDLLRRFVSAPHACNLSVGNRRVRLETNDPAILEAIRSATALSSNVHGEVAYRWKVIRDEKALCGGQEITILSAGPLSALLLGTGTLFAIDRQQHEVLGFIAPDISAEKLVAELFPLITELSREPHPAATGGTLSQ